MEAGAHDDPAGLVDHYFRHAYARLVATLARRFGLGALARVEDAVQEALLTALTAWSLKGVHQDPGAWLYQVAFNTLRDQSRRDGAWRRSAERLGHDEVTAPTEPSLRGEIHDDELRMLVARVDVPSAVRGAVLGDADPAAREAYIARYVDYFGARAFVGSRVAVYEHSSVARDLLCELFAQLGVEVVRLGRTDVFVPIDTEAVRPEDVIQARRWAREHRFDAIVSTDGDADRPLIGDECGEWLRGDAVGVLCARYLRVDIAVTPVSSNTAVERCGAFDRIVRTRIGSPYVIAGMAAAAGPDTVVAGYEANGGFLLGSPVVRGERQLAPLPTRDAVLPMLALLSAARDAGLRLSALPATLPPRFTASDRLQEFASERSGELIERLAADEAVAGALLAPDSGRVAHIDRSDGLRVAFANGDIVHLRASGNAPELRCYAESDTVDGAKQLCDDCLGRIARGQIEAVAAALGDEWPQTGTGGEHW